MIVRLLERLALHVTDAGGAPWATLRIFDGEGVDGTLRREQTVWVEPGDNGWAWVRLIDDLKVSKGDVVTFQLGDDVVLSGRCPVRPDARM